MSTDPKAEKAPDNSDLLVRPPGSMEGSTVVPADPPKDPMTGVEPPPETEEEKLHPDVSPPDPSQAVVGEPLVAPAHSPDHGGKP